MSAPEYERLRGLVVGTMCHCDDPDDCFDHWEFFIVDNPDAVRASGHVGHAGVMTPGEMRAVARLVRSTPIPSITNHQKADQP